MRQAPIYRLLLILVPLVAYSAYLAYSRVAHPAGPWHDRVALFLALMLGLPFAVRLAPSLSSQIVVGALYLALGSVVLLVYTFVFVGVMFGLWL